LALVERKNLTKPTAGNGCGFFVTLAVPPPKKRKTHEQNN